MALHAQGKYAEAEAEFRAIRDELGGELGLAHPAVSKATNNLAATLQGQRKFDEAEVELRAVLESLARDPRTRFTPTPGWRWAISAWRCMGGGKYVEAESFNRQSLSVCLDAYGPEHPNVAVVRLNLANNLEAQKRLDEAEQEIRTALATREQVLEPDHPGIAKAQMALGHMRVLRGAPDEALPLLEQRVGAARSAGLTTGAPRSRSPSPSPRRWR